MEKREKIIVLTAIAILVIGGFEFFYSPSGKKEQEARQMNIEDEKTQMAAFVTKVQAEVALNKVDDDLRYLLSRIEADWMGDPFYEGANPFLKTFKDEEPETDLPITIVYSGYIGVGERRMAVLNGNEYEIGEQIDEGVYLVKQIFPDHLVLEEKVAENKMARRYVIPLTEE